MPDYLSYTGNLCVATPDNNDALLIWPKINGNVEYGVQILTETNGVISIMVDEQMHPLSDYGYDEIVMDVIKEKEMILQDLLQIAKKQWDL